jgi:hypothetical protein
MQSESYKREVIKEMQRVAGLFSGNFTRKQYEREAKGIYSFGKVRSRLKLSLNKLKGMAGISINEATRERKPKIKPKKIKKGNVTERHCNMSNCNRLFDAVDDMRSCPSCTALKSKGGVSW